MCIFDISCYIFAASWIPSLPIQGSSTAEQYIRIEYEAAMRVKHGWVLQVQRQPKFEGAEPEGGAK